MRKKDELAAGAQGCLAKAKDDEMLFILRALEMRKHKDAKTPD